jgi:hypothetical protein
MLARRLINALLLGGMIAACAREWKNDRQAQARAESEQEAIRVRLVSSRALTILFQGLPIVLSAVAVGISVWAVSESRAQSIKTLELSDPVVIVYFNSKPSLEDVGWLIETVGLGPARITQVRIYFNDTVIEEEEESAWTKIMEYLNIPVEEVTGWELDGGGYIRKEQVLRGVCCKNLTSVAKGLCGLGLRSVRQPVQTGS